MLNPLVNGSLVVNITVDPNAEIGNYITANATIAPRIGDATPLNNSTTWSVLVMGSYDPNDIHVDRTTLTVTEVLSEPH